MSTGIYLSIDLDFWGILDVDDPVTGLVAFLDKVAALNLVKPVKVVIDHHDLLLDIEESKCRRIINVDYHSDLVDEEDPIGVDCGTWGNYIPWKAEGIFEWRYPSYEQCYRDALGRCEVSCNPDTANKHPERNPFEFDTSGWHMTRHTEGLYGIPWRWVREVGIAISPDYTHEGVVGVLLNGPWGWDMPDLELTPPEVWEEVHRMLLEGW